MENHNAEDLKLDPVFRLAIHGKMFRNDVKFKLVH